MLNSARLSLASLLLIAAPIGCSGDDPSTAEVGATPSAVAPTVTATARPTLDTDVYPVVMVPEAPGRVAREEVAKVDGEVREVSGEVRSEAIKDVGEVRGSVDHARGEARKAVEGAQHDARDKARSVEAEVKKEARDVGEKVLGDLLGDPKN